MAAFRSGFGNIMNVCRCEYVSTSPQMRPEGITCRRKLQNAAPLPASCPKEPLILTLSPKLYWLQLRSRQILSASVVSWHLQGRPFNEGALGAAYFSGLFGVPMDLVVFVRFRRRLGGIAPRIAAGETVLVVGHKNSLKAWEP